jgi:hypothetical protein
VRGSNLPGVHVNDVRDQAALAALRPAAASLRFAGTVTLPAADPTAPRALRRVEQPVPPRPVPGARSRALFGRTALPVYLAPVRVSEVTGRTNAPSQERLIPVPVPASASDGPTEVLPAVVERRSPRIAWPRHAAAQARAVLHTLSGRPVVTDWTRDPELLAELNATAREQSAPAATMAHRLDARLAEDDGRLTLLEAAHERFRAWMAAWESAPLVSLNSRQPLPRREPGQSFGLREPGPGLDVPLAWVGGAA